MIHQDNYRTGGRGHPRMMRGVRMMSRFGGGWSEHPTRGHGRGRRRRFEGGELRLLLLKLIEDAPRHGYDLIRAIDERSGGAYAPSPGVVYPTLTLLDDMGLIVEDRSEGARKLFAITTAGRAHLAGNAEAVAALLAGLDALAAREARTDVAPVKRAMMNLRAVLQHRLGEGELPRESIDRMVELIDETARSIERL